MQKRGLLCSNSSIISCNHKKIRKQGFQAAGIFYDIYDTTLFYGIEVVDEISVVGLQFLKIDKRGGQFFWILAIT